MTPTIDKFLRNCSRNKWTLFSLSLPQRADSQDIFLSFHQIILFLNLLCEIDKNKKFYIYYSSNLSRKLLQVQDHIFYDFLFYIFFFYCLLCSIFFSFRLLKKTPKYTFFFFQIEVRNRLPIFFFYLSVRLLYLFKNKRL